MPVEDLLLAGGKLMLLGMGIVFGFLIVLVFTMRGMSAAAGLLDRGKTEHGSTAPASGTVLQPVGQDQLVAVIAAAVARYRAARIG